MDKKKLKNMIIFIGGVFFAAGKATITVLWLAIIFLILESNNIIFSQLQRFTTVFMIFTGEYIYSLLLFNKAQNLNEWRRY